MAKSNIISFQDHVDVIRVLSNHTIHNLSRLSNTASFPVIRAGMMAYAAIKNREYTFDEEETFYEDFMTELDIKNTLVRTVMAEMDKQEYLDVFQECKDQLPAATELLYTTQYFDQASEYIGAVLSCQSGDELLWICVSPDWEVIVCTEIELKAKWVAALATTYQYATYTNINQWPRVISGSVDA